jgi:hypothetical protein
MRANLFFPARSLQLSQQQLPWDGYATFQREYDIETNIIACFAYFARDKCITGSQKVLNLVLLKHVLLWELAEGNYH